MNDNPFRPQEVKLVNFNKVDLEKNKLDDISKRMQNVKGMSREYQQGYQPKGYSDVLKKPEGYSDHIVRKDDSYGTNMKRPGGYSDAFKNN